MVSDIHLSDVKADPVKMELSKSHDCWTSFVAVPETSATLVYMPQRQGVQLKKRKE